MNTCITCPRRRQSGLSLSNTATTVMAVISAMTFAASGAAPTPLYQQYHPGDDCFRALTFSGAVAVVSLRNVSADRILVRGIPALASGVAITLLGVQTQLLGLMLVGTIVFGHWLRRCICGRHEIRNATSPSA